MSNKIAKNVVKSREVVMNEVANEAIGAVRHILEKSDLSNVEILAVMTSITRGFKEATKRSLTEYSKK